MKFLKRKIDVLCVAASSLALAACGGGGGSGGGVGSTPTPPPAQFTSFTNVPANTSTTVSGTTREGTVAVSATGTLPLSGVSNPTEGTGNVTFTVNSQRQATALSIAGASSSASFNSSSIYASLLDRNDRPVGVIVSNSSGSDQAIYADPYVLGFDYQSFGVWGSGLVPSSTGRYGAISVGAETSAATVPTTGNVTFNGFAGGIYVDVNGASYRYGANATFGVNFGTRVIDMTTSGDVLVNIERNTRSFPTSPITARLTYAAGSNSFSGTFQAGTFMSGTGSGKFYGPNARELGGTFFISGSGGKMVGGFGAKQ